MNRATIADEEPLPRVFRGDPGGPAARAGLLVGNIITHVDGIDVTGSIPIEAMLAVPPGTAITLTLARGVAVAITLE